MNKDFIVPISETEEVSKQRYKPISLLELATARSTESTKSIKSTRTSDSKEDRRLRAGHDISRIHFTLEKEGDSKIPTMLSGGLGYHDPIQVHASHRFTEILMNNSVEEGLYNIRLAVSLDELNIERIESISFNQRHDDRLGAMEVREQQDIVFTKHELRELKKQIAASGTGMVVLGLHHQYCVEKFEPRSFVMEIRTTTRPLPLNDPGYINIHYLELDVTQYETKVDHIDDGDVFYLHRPFIWSVDVGIKEDTSAVPHGQKPPTMSGRIIYYAVSGDGNHVATLSTRGEILQLDMWGLGAHTTCIANTSTMEGQETKCHCIACKAPVTPKPCGQHRITIDEPLDSDIFFDDRYDYLRHDPSPLQIAVSYDASRVVLMDAKEKYLRDAPFQVFGPKLSCTSSDHIPPDLRDFSGYGKFHFTSKSRDLKDELFITCDGMNVDIFTINQVHDQSKLFRVYDEWELVRRITLAERPEDAIPMPRRLIEGLSGKYLHFLAKNETQLVGDLETGELLHGMAGQGTGSISGDGSMMLIHQYPNIITTRWTESGTILGKTDLSVGNLYSSGPSFIRNDNYVLVPVSKNDDSYGKGRLGMILDTPTLSITERVSYTSRYHEQLPQMAGDCGQFLYCSHGSKLDMVRLQDILVAPYPQSKYHCGDECLEVSVNLDGSGAREEEKVFIEGDLTLYVGFEEVAERQYAVVVTIVDSQDEWREVIRIPPLTIGNIITKYGVYVDRESLQLFVVCNLFAMVWTLPTTFDGAAILESCLWAQMFYYEDTMDGREVAEKVDLTLKVCNHGGIIVTPKNEPGEFPKRTDGSTEPDTPKSVKKNVVKSEAGSTGMESEVKLNDESSVTEEKEWQHVKSQEECRKMKERISAPKSTTFPLFSDGSLSRDPFRFFNGLFALMHLFHIGKEPVRQAILHFIGLHINRTVDCNGYTLTILREICLNVKETNYALTETFLKAIFNSPHVQWVPKHRRVGFRNPISLLLGRCEELPRVFNLAQIMINYCVRMAKKKKDLHYSVPVLNSLQELLNVNERPPDLVTNILRDLAYCPAREKNFAIDHAIIVHPPSFRRLFGTPKKKPLYAHRDPIFAQDRSMLFREHDPLNENFTRDLFVASFDMLWFSPEPELEDDNRSPLERIRDTGPIPSPSWISILYHFHMSKIRPRPDRQIEFYDLPPETLNNPAIVALIKFKWYTIGYKYWLLRFCWQFVFYMMILVAVFLEVYDPTQGHSLRGMFIAIIVLGTIFLILELRQFFNHPRRYITSPYNVVDLLAFGVPLAGSIIQVNNIDNDNNKGHKATLSFSVLFVFLHMLYELRVNHSVCRFVAIIIRIVGKIRVFFLIFAAGIIAFAIAILHLIRGCPVGVCDTSDSKFPFLFHRAISTTYFMMGGIWDPVQDELENDESWSLRIMIMLYYFFSTMLLLNVLIALMNAAFDDGDVSWELVWNESRLRCIEEAEAVSYNIPNYREANPDIFPKKIYYFGTRKEQKVYWDKHLDGHEEDCDDTHVGSSNSTDTGHSSSSGAARQAKTTDVRGIKQSQEEVKQEMQHMSQEMKKEIQHSHEQIRILQRQLGDMKEMLAKFMSMDPTKQ
ncbi:MAG: hypothetical protein J3Q66DRAFT_434647 [Benniella sp.]|nr:MAG: hypothetical protein J3Q66DRAFT_434647 [Benniella sp.]